MVDDVRLPDDIERGARGGPGFKTTVITLSNGREFRNQEWQVARGAWDIGYGLKKREDMDAVISFFYARRGRAHGFRFRDWSDYKLDAEFVAAVDGDDTKRQIVKTYDPGGLREYVRVVTHPVNNASFKVYVNDLLVVTGFTIDFQTGILDFTLNPGVNVKVSAEYDVPARFDIDTLPIAMNTQFEGAFPGIAIVELRE